MYTLETGIYAIITAFVAGVIICPLMIPFLVRLKFGQTVRDDGPSTHLKKSGTPTMGGLGIIAALIIGSVFYLKNNPDGAAVLITTLAFGAIGFLDDYIKVVKKRSLGLRAYQKLIGQIVITALFTAYVIKSGLGTEIYIPFGGGKTLDLGIIYIPFLFIAMLGTVNGANLTDGLDGLASGVTVIVSMFFMMISWAAGSGALPVAGAVIGSLMAFLIFNSYPARVFMGDTGSLALGGFVAAAALITKTPLFILMVGVIYLMETLSVMIQVSYYKKTKKRVFKMAPIHHHFELCGWSETKVVSVFSIITALACLISFLGAQYMF